MSGVRHAGYRVCRICRVYGVQGAGNAGYKMCRVQCVQGVGYAGCVWDGRAQGAAMIFIRNFHNVHKMFILAFLVAFM